MLKSTTTRDGPKSPDKNAVKPPARAKTAFTFVSSYKRQPARAETAFTCVSSYNLRKPRAETAVTYASSCAKNHMP